MKKIMLIIVLFCTSVFSQDKQKKKQKDISPVISIRYDQIDDEVVVTDAIGLKFGLGNDRFTGYDTDGTDHRLYVGWKFGKIGFGHDGTNPEYTIGANYYILDNIGLDLDFIMGDNNENNIRLSLNINFP